MSSSELRQRHANKSIDTSSTNQSITDKLLENDSQASTTPSTPSPSKYKNWWIRLSSTIAIILLVTGIFYAGPTAMVLLVIVIQLNAFNEIITIGYRIYKLYELPRFRTISWYFLICINYYYYGALVQDNFGWALSARSGVIQFFLQNHKMISYFMAISGFIVFVLSLRKGYYAKQFFFFGWTIVSLIAVVMQSYFVIQNIMHGIFWFVLPCLLVAINDSMAYIVGFFWPWEKTPLIKLSPKKTWEGFFGGAFFTLLVGWFIGAKFAQYQYLTCPVEFDEYFGFRVESNCTINEIFQVRDLFKVPAMLVPIVGKEVIRMRLVQVHSCVIALFASGVAPFGGFFASGLKRAFKIKDFGDSIPGHGGFLDRFDCHLMMSTFVYVYLATFVKYPNITKILEAVGKLDFMEIQGLLVSILKMIKDSLSEEQLDGLREKLMASLQ